MHCFEELLLRVFRKGSYYSSSADTFHAPCASFCYNFFTRLLHALIRWNTCKSCSTRGFNRALTLSFLCATSENYLQLANFLCPFSCCCLQKFLPCAFREGISSVRCAEVPLCVFCEGIFSVRCYQKLPPCSVLNETFPCAVSKWISLCDILPRLSVGAKSLCLFCALVCNDFLRWLCCHKFPQKFLHDLIRYSTSDPVLHELFSGIFCRVAFSAPFCKRFFWALFCWAIHSVLLFGAFRLIFFCSELVTEVFTCTNCLCPLCALFWKTRSRCLLSVSFSIRLSTAAFSVRCFWGTYYMLCFQELFESATSKNFLVHLFADVFSCAHFCSSIFAESFSSAVANWFSRAVFSGGFFCSPKSKFLWLLLFIFSKIFFMHQFFGPFPRCYLARLQRTAVFMERISCAVLRNLVLPCAILKGIFLSSFCRWLIFAIFW